MKFYINIFSVNIKIAEFSCSVFLNDYIKILNSV